MDNYSNPVPPSDTESAELWNQRVRMICQVLGFLMIVVGGFYLLWVFVDVVRFARDPASMEPALESMCVRIGGDKLSFQVDKDRVELGRVAAGVVLFLWYILCVVVPLCLVKLGARIIAWTLDQRRQIKAILKEILTEVRKPSSD
jgi:hypothetical protein